MADDKPAFDPSQPFELADKPPFDPSKPFESAEKPLTWSEVPGQALSNLRSSAAETAKGLYQTVRHPIQAGENLAGVAAGFGQKSGLLPNTGAASQDYEPYANAMIDFFKQRYGGVDELKHTMAHDPVGFAADLSTAFGGGELALARAPGVIGKAGEVSGAVSRATNPLSVVTEALPAIAKRTPFVGDTAEANDILAKEGVLRTPGQRVGGVFKTLEDAATTVPILRTFVKQGRAASVESFNQAVANQALEPIGETVKARAGHAMIKEVENKLGNAYDNLLPKLSFDMDNDFVNDLARIRNDAKTNMTAERADQYDRIVQSRLPVAAAGKSFTGEEFKSIESQLKTVANRYRSSLDGDQRAVAESLDQTVKAMKAGLERSNPVFAPELYEINSGWAIYAHMRTAATRRATSGGVFTPNDLLSASRAGDKTVGHGSFAKGEALMQKFAEAGQQVLPSELPSSGTAERLLHSGALAAGASFAATHPHLVAAGAAAAAPYTKIGMKATDVAARNKLFSRVPARALQVSRVSAMASPPSITVPRRADERKSGGAVKPAFDPSSIGARKAKNHQWFIPDPNRPGHYLQVLPKKLGHARRLRPQSN